MVTVLGLGPVACGRPAEVPGADAGDDSSQPGDGGTPSSADGPPPPPTPLECAAMQRMLEAEITGSPGQLCSAVVRLAYDTYAPTDWMMLCGPIAQVSQDQALAAAAQAYSPPYGLPEPPHPLNPDPPTDAFVIEWEPADYGEFAVVSAWTGLALVGGDLNYSGPARVVYPASWRDLAELGDGCTTSAQPPLPSAYDLAPDSLRVTQADTDRAVAAVASTALFAAFTSPGMVMPNIVLVRLQRTVDGSSRPTSTSEWVAILQGGGP
jgi:hypothetical protein